MFSKEKTIKDRGFSIVESGTWGGQPAIKKQYFPGQQQRFKSEVRNLGCLRELGFAQAVNLLYEDPKSKIIISLDVRNKNKNNPFSFNFKEGLNQRT